MVTDYLRYGAASDGHATPLPAICQLPTELIAEVIRLVLPPLDLVSKPVEPRLRAHMRRLYTLRLVMNRWHEIIDGTPTFWKFILSTLPSHVNDMTILRSDNGPLAVVYSTAFGNGDEHPSLGDFLRGIAHTYPRWSAYIGIVVREYLETPAPLLRHVSLEGISNDIEPLELLGGYSTSLRYVDLSQVSIRWKMGLFTQLNVLKLRHVGQHGLTTSHLLDFLHASPRLQLLELTDVHTTNSNPTYPQVITLPHLQSIILCACENNLIESLLRQIRAPSCSKFYLTILHVDEPNLPKFLDETLQPFHGIMRAMHERVGLSEIILDAFGFQWHVPQKNVEDQELYVSIDCPIPITCIRWVERILQGNFGLSIHFSHGTLNQAVLETVAPMRCVTKVVIGGMGDGEDTLQILRFLSEPLWTNPSAPSLPYLQELRLTSVGWNAQDLMDMVLSRFNNFPWETMERPLLSITMSRGAFSWTGRPRPILEYAVLSKIRNTNGVKDVAFVGLGEPFGMLGVSWDEENSKPGWG